MASAAGAILTYIFGQRAVKASHRAELATLKAQEDAATAQSAALEAAKQLVEVAKETTPLLQEISKTGQATHVLVNNDRSILKARIADLTRLVARLMPEDADAAAAAAEAQKDVDRSPRVEKE
jgi:hypothetical protein